MTRTTTTTTKSYKTIVQVMCVSRYLCDVVHAPGKTGGDLLTYLDKQWATLGLNRYECVNGVGNGGGRMKVSMGSTICWRGQEETT